MKKQNLLLGLALLVATAGAYQFLHQYGPEPKPSKKQQPVKLTVVTKPLAISDYQPVFEGQATLVPVSRISLASEVSGRVLRVNPNFHAGALIHKGEWLVELDARDLEESLAAARTKLQQARVALEEAKAQVAQKKEDWARSGHSEAPSPIALGLPQLELAQAATRESRLAVDRARRNIEKTRILSPFDARVVEATAARGQYATPGFSFGVLVDQRIDALVPLSVSEAKRLIVEPGDYVEVEGFSARILGFEPEVTGRALTRTLRLRLVEPVGDLFVGDRVSVRMPLAVIRGVYQVPAGLISPRGEVALAQAGVVRRIPVELLWWDDEVAVFRAEIPEGGRLIATPIGNVLEGTPVEEATPPNPAKARMSGVRVR